jgi:hypothetical protein
VEPEEAKAHPGCRVNDDDDDNDDYELRSQHSLSGIVTCV